MAEHTPGPWELDENVPGHPLIRGGDGTVVCAAKEQDAKFIVRACNEYDSLIEQRADLLAACEAALIRLRSAAPGTPSERQELDDRIAAAIAKATGGQPMKPCRQCGSASIAPSRISRGDWLCRDCCARKDAIRRESLRAQGRSVSGSNTWAPEKKAAWRERYYGQESVRTLLAEKARARRSNLMERERHEARWQANRAVASGRLVKEACQCGEAKVEGHHPDYSKPLEVIWLCRACHLQEHAKARGVPS